MAFVLLTASLAVLPAERAIAQQDPPQQDPDVPEASVDAPGYTVDAGVVARVRALASQAHHGSAHVNRWQRVLAAFGELDTAGVSGGAMSLAEAEDMANRHSSPVWDEVVAELAALEASSQQAPPPPPPPTPEVNITSAVGGTEGGSVSFTVTASPAPAADLAVSVTVAMSGDFGYGTAPTSVTIPTSKSATVTITTTDDDADEPDGSVTLTLNAGSGYTVGARSSETATVADDDAPVREQKQTPPPPPSNQLVVSVVESGAVREVVEGNPATFTLSATPAPDRDTSVRYRVFGGSASGYAGEHTAVIGTSGTAVITIPTVDDTVVRGNGLVGLAVVSGSGYRIHHPTYFAAVKVIDDERYSPRPPLYVTWSATDSVMVEGSSSDTAEVQVRLSRQLTSSETLTVDLDRTHTPSVWSFSLADSPSGVSFDSSLSRLTFTGPGADQTARITVTAVANVVDGTANGAVSRPFHLAAMAGVQGAVGYIGSAYQQRLMIIDSANTGAALSLFNGSGNSGYVHEGDYAWLVFKLPSARSQDTTVRFEAVGWGQYPTGGGDLGPLLDPPMRLVSADAQYETVIPAGRTFAVVAIPVVGDEVRDGDKMFRVSIVSTSPGARVRAATQHLLVAADTTPDPQARREILIEHPERGWVKGALRPSLPAS